MDEAEKVKKVTRCELYNNLWDAWKRAYPGQQKYQLQIDCNAYWTQVKSNFPLEENLESEVRRQTQELIGLVAIDKTRKIANFFKNVPAPKSSAIHSSNSNKQKFYENQNDDSNILPNTGNNTTCSSNLSSQNKINEDSNKNLKVSCKLTNERSSHETPSQDKSKKKIESLETKVSALETVKNVGFSDNSTDLKLKNLKKELSKEKKILKRKEADAIRQRKSRKNRKVLIKNLVTKFPEMKNDFKFRDGVLGRPRVEVDQPELLKAIIDIAAIGGAADARRQSECKFVNSKF